MRNDSERGRGHLLASGLAVLAAEDESGGGIVDPLRPGPPVTPQASQVKHHVLLVGHRRVVHGGACFVATQFCYLQVCLRAVVDDPLPFAWSSHLSQVL